MKNGAILFSSVVLCLCLQVSAAKPIDLGSRWELFVDDYLIDRREGIELRLQRPTPREIVMVHDAPWEGSGCGYHAAFRDGDRLRMYYIAADLTNEDGTKKARRPNYACYAESKDGIHWEKPEVGLIEFQGSKRNNIVWAGPGTDNFAAFKDPNPDCREGERYKATASGPGGLWALKSADGLHWSPLKDGPIIVKGAFDSLNAAFWDPQRKHYWCYLRDFHSGRPNVRYDGLRDIRVATSRDFITWTEPELLRYVDSPEEALYTNQVQPYYRAPHIFVGFPSRYVERPWSASFLPLPDLEHRRGRMKFQPRYGTALTDGLFMSSRDGRTFNRWGEAFIRPGIERKHNWVYGDGYQSLGLIETPAADPTAPPELTFYVNENHWKTASRLRRYTLRIDGFVSLNAPLKGGETVTKPIVFSGNRLSLNFSTSAAGSLRVEIQDADGTPIPGFALADCTEIIGDQIERAVSWKQGPDVGPLADRPIRLRFALKDADLFAFQFCSADSIGNGQ